MDNSLLEEFLCEIRENDLHVNYVLVRQGGEVIADFDRLGGRTRLNMWSAAKSFTSIGAGIAMEEGLISLDEKLCDSFKEYLPENPGENLTEIRVKHLLTMTSGLSGPLFFTDSKERVMTSDWVDYFFKNGRFDYAPGEHFLYSNFNTYMTSCLIEKKAGMNLCEYLKSRLFEPLGIYSPDWTMCPKGHCHAANGLYLTVDEFSNFAEMLLSGGVYNGKRIVSEDYIKEATKAQVTLDGARNGYGYQFWINPDGKTYRADGKLGQYAIVLPEKNTTVTVMSLDSGKVFTAVWDKIVSKL